MSSAPRFLKRSSVGAATEKGTSARLCSRSMAVDRDRLLQLGVEGEVRARARSRGQLDVAPGLAPKTFIDTATV